MSLLSAHHIIRHRRQNFLDYLKQVLTPEACEASFHDGAFEKAVYCLGQKQGMSVNRVKLGLIEKTRSLFQIHPSIFRVFSYNCTTKQPTILY